MVYMFGLNLAPGGCVQQGWTEHSLVRGLPWLHVADRVRGSSFRYHSITHTRYMHGDTRQYYYLL